jgi:protein-S-isoprenylcysteine O-methyltransferase Ste14
MGSCFGATEVFMTSRQAGVSQVANHGTNWLTTVASLAVGVSFFALWFWLLPSWLGFRVDTDGVAHWRWIGAVLSVLGLAVALRCIWDFGWTGLGTPAPIAPPQKLVVVGFYRYVPNPMYVGFFAGCLMRICDYKFAVYGIFAEWQFQNLLSPMPSTRGRAARELVR